MRWHWTSFEELSGREVYELMSLRQRVFVVEQRCPYLDADGKDLVSQHLLGWQGQSLVAYLRVTPPGTRFGERGIGRVVTAPEVRRTGLGRAIVQEALRRYGHKPLRISSQQYLEKFYAGFGFVTVQGPYDEDGIAHLEMLRAQGGVAAVAG